MLPAQYVEGIKSLFECFFVFGMSAASLKKGKMPLFSRHDLVSRAAIKIVAQRLCSKIG